MENQVRAASGVSLASPTMMRSLDGIGRQWSTGAANCEPGANF
jgi:hypothetical protein